MEISRFFEVAADHNNCAVILAKIRIICGDRTVATISQRAHKAQIQRAHGPIEKKKDCFYTNQTQPNFRAHSNVCTRTQNKKHDSCKPFYLKTKCADDTFINGDHVPHGERAAGPFSKLCIMTQKS